MLISCPWSETLLMALTDDQQEVEKLRELNLQAEQDKMSAVAEARSEVKEEVGKMKDKIREVKDDRFVFLLTLCFCCSSLPVEVVGRCCEDMKRINPGRR